MSPNAQRIRTGGPVKTCGFHERKEKNDSGRVIAVEAVAEADEAAKRGDGQAAFDVWKRAGTWAFDVRTGRTERIVSLLPGRGILLPVLKVDAS